MFNGRDAGGADGTMLPRRGMHRILVCRLIHTLGNSLMILPLLEELARVYPGAEIDIVTGYPEAQRIYAKCPGVRRIIRTPARPLRHPLRMWRCLSRMRRQQYDLAIDPDPDSTSGRLLVLLAHCRRSLGFSGPHKPGAMTHSVAPPIGTWHNARLPVFLLHRALGASTAAADFPKPALCLDTRERADGHDELDRLCRLVQPANRQRGCIGVFANATGEKRLDRCWWSRFLAEFASAICGFQLIEIVPATGRSLLDDRYPAFFSSDLRKVASVLGELRFFVSADCGIMHLAVAAGTSTFGVFTAGDIERWGPFGEFNVALDARQLSPEQTAQCALAALAALPTRHAVRDWQHHNGDASHMQLECDADRRAHGSAASTPMHHTHGDL